MGTPANTVALLNSARVSFGTAVATAEATIASVTTNGVEVRLGAYASAGPCRGLEEGSASEER